MKVKHLFYLLLFVCIIPPVLWGQATHAKFKMGIESGGINTSALGAGFIVRPFVKINGYKNYNHSSFQFKTNASSEILGVSEQIAGLHFFVKLLYKMDFGPDKLLISGSARNQLHFIRSSEKQVFNELQENIHYSRRLSRRYNVLLKQWFLFREQSYTENVRLFKNSFQANLVIKNVSKGNWNVGLFLEDIVYDYSQGRKNRYSRFGPAFEFNYKKSLILNILYKYGFYKTGRLNDHQFNILAGKYLTKKLSLFLFVYYLWREEGAPKVSGQEFNFLENYNNISAKLGYDLQKNTLLYLRFIYDEQQIFKGTKPISTFQGLVGIQKSF